MKTDAALSRANDEANNSQATRLRIADFVASCAVERGNLWQVFEIIIRNGLTSASLVINAATAILIRANASICLLNYCILWIDFRTMS